MQIHVFDDSSTLGRVAATVAAEIIADSIAARGRARIIAATGASQFQFLSALVERRELPWAQVELFHLDEYLNLPPTHGASFRRYLNERLIGPTGIVTAHLLDGEQDPEIVCQSVGHQIASAPIDVAFVGIGENGHLAFNDPPADFDTREPYIVVELDEACRRQQVGEGWFDSIQAVPERAITMSIPQILKSRAIVAVVPEARKAEAVRRCFEGDVSPQAPASVLRRHADTLAFLDVDSAALLTGAHKTHV